MVPKNYQVMLDGSEHLWYNAEVLQCDVGWTLVRAWIVRVAYGQHAGHELHPLVHRLGGWEGQPQSLQGLVQSMVKMTLLLLLWLRQHEETFLQIDKVWVLRLLKNGEGFE